MPPHQARTIQITAIAADSTLKNGQLEYQRDDSPLPHSIRIALDDLGEWAAQGYDIIHCLDQLRAQIEPSAGVRLCLNACRVNAISSGMSRDMGGGASVYLV